MENKPLVSVIIPTYNRADVLKRSVQSVLNQTYQNFEIIIVDDASDDETDLIIKDLANCCQIKYKKLINRSGAAVARNKGMEIAQGQFIAFLDSDDEWLSNKLEKQVELFSNSSAKTGVIYSGLRIIKNGEFYENRVPDVRGNIFNKIVLQNKVGPLSTGLIRRKCIENCGMFDEAMPACQDWDFWIKISKKYLFDFVSDILVNYYVTHDSITMNYNARAIGYSNILKKYYKQIVQNKKANSEILFTIGYYYSRSGNGSLGLTNLLKAIRIHPYKIKNYMHLFLILLGAKNYNKCIEIKNKLLSIW